VFKAREKKNPKFTVAMKKILMENEKEGVSQYVLYILYQRMVNKLSDETINYCRYYKVFDAQDNIFIILQDNEN